VVTKWGVNVIPYPGGISEKIKVLRQAPGKATFAVVAESTMQAVAGGVNSFDTRIPIQAGDRIGVVSQVAAGVGTIFCGEGSGPGELMGAVPGDAGVGTTATFSEEVPGAQAAVTATIEPDVDGDGFGDETQDKCPQSKTAQTPCPVLILDAVGQAPGKGSVRILVASSSDAAITVSARAKLPGKKAKASALAKLTPINQLVTPGKIATYVLNYPKSLKDALKALPRKKTLSLNVTASGTGLAGGTSSDKLTVKLKGQADAPKKRSG
jgi:hypothetical protein